jgi:hypothetical protein
MTVANRGADELRSISGVSKVNVFAATELYSARCSALVRVRLDRLPIHLHSKCLVKIQGQDTAPSSQYSSV